MSIGKDDPEHLRRVRFRRSYDRKGAGVPDPPLHRAGRHHLCARQGAPTDCFDHSVQENDLPTSSFRTPTSKPKSAAAIPNQIYLRSNWTSLIVHGIRDKRRVRVQPRNEGIIVCAFL